MKRRRTKQTDATSLTNPEVNSEEFKLLHRLFIPNNYLIKNNQVSVHELVANLPRLVEDHDVNLALHLLMASVVINYVSSWYLGKLNTENPEFIVVVYRMLTVLVRDLIARLQKVSAAELGNQCVQVLDEHIGALLVHGSSELKVTRPSYKNDLGGSTLDDYLRRSHLVFSDEHTYYRCVGRGMLEHSLGSTGSKIADDLVLLVVADLVMAKVVGLISSPQFLLKGIRDVLESKSNTDSKSTNIKSTNNVLSSSTSDNSRFSRVWGWLHSPFPSVNYEASFFNTNLFSLFNTVTDYSNRKPLLSAVLRCVWGAVKSSKHLQACVDYVIMSQVDSTIQKILSPGNVSGTINSLRVSLFGEKKEEQEPVDVDEIATRLAEVVAVVKMPWEKNTSRPHIRRLLALFSGEHEKDSEAERECVSKESSRLNKLLVVNLLDCVVSNMYPEMTMSTVSEANCAREND